MKKVVAIIGSLRKDSIHRQIFDHYKNLAKEQFELIEGEIKDFPLYSQDYTEFPSSVNLLGSQLEQASGVIFFTPEYNYSIPGGLKNALDWLSRLENKPLDSLAASIIGASPGKVGTARMQYHLRQVGVFLNLNFMNRPEVMISESFEKIKHGKIEDEATVKFLEKHAQSFQAFLN